MKLLETSSQMKSTFSLATNFMKELKLWIEAIELVRESKKGKVNQTSRETMEGLIATDKIISPSC